MLSGRAAEKNIETTDPKELVKLPAGQCLQMFCIIYDGYVYTQIQEVSGITQFFRG